MPSRARRSPLRGTLDFLLALLRKVGADRVMLLASGLSFVASVTLAPLVIVTLGAVGLVADRGQVQEYLVQHVQQLTGADTAGLVGQLAESERERGSGALATVLGAVTLLIGATGVFVQLQDGLNIVWDVEPKPGNGLMVFLRQRLLSLAMLLSLGFLLLTSLLASAVLSAALERLSSFSGMELAAGVVANVVVSVGLSCVLFALLFRYVPDARTAWRDVWLGGAVTALLFHAGQWGISQYLARAAVGSPYGAAGSVIVLLMWVYYSAVIVFVGAEFTQQWAVLRGRGTVPTAHARRGHAPPKRAATAGARR